MDDRRPFDLKLERAAHHLADFEQAAAAYVDSRPYEPRRTVGDDGQPEFTFHITPQPDPTLALIVGDLLTNARASLDHLAIALAPPARKRSARWPIIFRGHCEPPPAGAGGRHAEDHKRWCSYTEGMDPAAVEIIKKLQPLEADDRTTHPLAMLNRLVNADKHYQLTVVASALVDVQVLVTTADGAEALMRSTGAARDGLFDGEPIGGVPADAVALGVTGTLHVVIREAAMTEHGYEVPRAFREALLPSCATAIDELRPYT
jgi:hypothetical protein